MDFAALTDQANGNPPDPDDGYNGGAGEISMTRPTDYTSDWGKICTVANQLDLLQTGTYYLWLAQDKPDAATQVTAEHIDVMKDRLITLMARVDIYTLFNAGQVDIQFRESDVYDFTEIAAAARKADYVRALVNYYRTDPEAKVAVANRGKLVLGSIVCGAIHREQQEDHECFTAELDNKRSPTAKATQVAGMDADKLLDFMKKDHNGHETGHHLATATQKRMARLICKTDENAQINVAVDYMGKDQIGKEVSDLLYLGEAAKNRFPAGQLGKAGVLIGVSMCKATIAVLATKVHMENVEYISTAAVDMGAAITHTNVSHDLMLHYAGILGPTFAFNWGFLTGTKNLREGDYAAYDAIAKRYPAERISGRALASAFKLLRAHDQAIVTSIFQCLASMGSSLSLAATYGTNLAGDVSNGPGARLLLAEPVEHKPNGIGIKVAEGGLVNTTAIVPVDDGGFYDAM